nr:hypothetical protein [Tanacetum cinerariifolium]
GTNRHIGVTESYTKAKVGYERFQLAVDALISLFKNLKGVSAEDIKKITGDRRWRSKVSYDLTSILYMSIEPKLKTSEEVKATKEVPEEKLKEMMQLVPVEEIYVKALQVKHPIIDWKHLDREDLNQLWALVKESLHIRPASSDKEMELWVELKRLYEPDVKDQLWTHTHNIMHAPVEWKLYDSCGVHHVTSKDNEIFIVIEKDCPQRKGLAIVMISYKFQVENYSQMEK